MKKENLPVIVAVALPILLVVCIAILAMLPNLGPKPQYDFLFTQSNSRAYYPSNGGCEVFANYFAIENVDGQEKLVKKPYTVSVFDKPDFAEPCTGYPQIADRDVADLFIYHMENGTTRAITFEEASQLVVRGKLISPDGYTVAKRYMNRGILDIFGGNNSGIYASKKNRHTKLEIDQFSQTNYYDRDFVFIGWVEPVK